MPHYNENEIQAANQVDLAAFLFARGETLKKRGRQLLWERHQVWIDGCRWYSHYVAKGGYAIRFVMQYFGLTFQEAVAELLGGTISSEPIQPKLREEKQLVLPPPNPTMNRIYAYLMQERGIDREIVHHADDRTSLDDSRRAQELTQRHIRRNKNSGVPDEGTPQVIL